MKQAYRHGENLLVEIATLPDGAKKLGTKIFATGSHGNNHSIDVGSIHKHEDTLYIEAIGTSLLHPEHSPNIGDAKIDDGFYKIVTQTEYTPDGLIPVID